MRTKKILVTGAGGFIGGYLVNDLVSKGHNVVAADIKPADHRFQVSDGANNFADSEIITQYFGKDFGIDHRVYQFHLWYLVGGREKASAGIRSL